MTESSIFQSSNIGMNTSMVSLYYPKNRFPKNQVLSPGKVHRQKSAHKSVIIQRRFLFSTYQNILKQKLSETNDWPISYIA